MARRPLVFCLVVGLALCCPTAQALEREDVARIIFDVRASRDAEALEALRLLRDKGFLATDGGTRASGLWADAYDEAFRRDGDLMVTLNQTMVNRLLASEVFTETLPDDVKELRLSLEKGALLAKGVLDGPLFLNPSFKATLDVVSVGRDAVEIRVQSAKVAGVEVKRLSGIVFRYLEDTMMERLGAFASMKNVGMRDGEYYVISVKVRSERILPMTVNTEVLPMLEGAYLSYVELRGQRLRCCFRFSGLQSE